MKKVYYIYTVESCNESVEDPRCPWRWRGSGCYDITYYNNVYHRYAAAALSAREAIEAFERYVQKQIDLRCRKVRANYAGFREATLRSFVSQEARRVRAELGVITGVAAVPVDPDELPATDVTDDLTIDPGIWTLDEESPDFEDCLDVFGDGGDVISEDSFSYELDPADRRTLVLVPLRGAA